MADEAKKSTEVQAEDGQTYSFGERQKVKKLSSITETAIVTKFVFRNGAVRTHETPLANVGMVAKSAAHGLDQKFGDEFSGLDDPEDCVIAFEKLSERLDKGEWSETRQSEGLAGTGLLVRALVQVTGQSLEQVKATLETLSKEDKASLRKQRDIAAAIAELQAAKLERAAAKGKIPDGNAVLAEKFGRAAA